jgi:hypothetical protein
MSDLPELLFDLVGLISELGGIRKLLKLATAASGADFAARGDALWRDFVELLQLPKKGDVKVDIATERIDLVGEEAQKCKKLVIPSTGTLVGQLTFDI